MWQWDDLKGNWLESHFAWNSCLMHLWEIFTKSPSNVQLLDWFAVNTYQCGILLFLYVSTLLKTKHSLKLLSRQYSVISRFQTGKFHFKKSESHLNTRKLKCTVDISVEANPCNSDSGVNLPFHFSLVLLWSRWLLFMTYLWVIFALFFQRVLSLINAIKVLRIAKNSCHLSTQPNNKNWFWFEISQSETLITTEELFSSSRKKSYFSKNIVLSSRQIALHCLFQFLYEQQIQMLT